MVALFSLLWTALHSELDPHLPPSVKAFRINASLLTMVVMGVVIFWRQRLLRAELSTFLEGSRRSFDELKAVQLKLIQSEKLASLGQLVGGAAHEINNPLTAMLGYSDLLNTSNLPPEENVQAAQIAEQVRRATALVASLLTFARQSPAQFAIVDINSVLQTTARLLAPQFKAQAISINLDLANSLSPVLADSNQILHVCMHLAGQVTTDLNCETHTTLFIRTREDGNLVLVDFCFYNTSADLPSPPFSFPSVFAGDNHHQPTSLFPSACCRIVEEQGGRLLLASDSGNSAFRMELQLATDSARLVSFAAPKQDAARSGS